METLTIDSNILIYHLQGDTVVRGMLDQWFAAHNRLFISAITRIEVLAAPILKPDEEAVIQQLLSRFLMLPVDASIADAAARIRRLHRLKLGDSIIAATAILTSSAIATRNVRDFRKIPELQILAV